MKTKVFFQTAGWVLFFFGISVCLFAQPQEDDSVKQLEREVECLLKGELLPHSDSAARGGIYVKLGDLLSTRYCYEQALEYYRKAYTAYVAAGDVKGASRSLSAVAKSEFMLARYDRSVSSYQQALSMAGRIRDTNGTIEILNCLSAVMLYSSGGKGMGKAVLEQGEQAIGIPQEQLAALCAHAAALDKETGGVLMDLPYLKGDEKIRDSLNKAGEAFLADFNTLKAELALAAAQNARMERRERELLAVFAAVIVLVLGGGAWLVYRLLDKQRALMQEQVRTAERLQVVNGMLENKVSGFRRFLDAAASKRERPAEFLSAFKRYINIENGRLPDAFGDVIEIADWQYNGIITRLRLQYPALNDEELYLCALIALDFPMGSIKFIYNHASEESMYNKRARLKKKLGLGPEERPEKFIKEQISLPIASC